MHTIIVSAVPGRRRAGYVFSGVQEFPLLHFTREELKVIMADPQLTVIQGSVIHPDFLDDFLRVREYAAKEIAKDEEEFRADVAESDARIAAAKAQGTLRPPPPPPVKPAKSPLRNA